MDKCMHRFAGFNREDLVNIVELGKDGLENSNFVNKIADLQISYSDLITILSALDVYYKTASKSSEFFSEKELERQRRLYRDIMDTVTKIKEEEAYNILENQDLNCPICLNMIEDDVPAFWSGKVYCENCWLYHKHDIVFTKKFDKIEDKEKQETRSNESGK